MLELKVRDFGPIKEGHVRFRPLTIFIGANNTGKSYMAQIAYALGRLFSHPWRAHLLRSYAGPLIEIKVGAEGYQTLAELCRRDELLNLNELPQELREAFEQGLQAFFGELSKRAAEELQRCFGSTLRELVRSEAASFSLELYQPQPLTRLRLDLDDGELHLTEAAWDREIRFDPTGFLPERQGRVVIFPISITAFHFLFTWHHYLPAARSGILQGHKALGSFILGRLPLVFVGIERFDIPRLSGVVADFLGQVLTIEGERRSSPAADVAEFLEKEICGGQIELERVSPEVAYPEPCYRQQNLKLPMHRASSMVSELAPIVLFLKYVVGKGDLLIIEEPEAHLHPDHQLSLARGIARLVHHGVRLLVTTHSDYFLHQISNLVQASSADRETKAALKYADEEQLKAEQVGVYLFRTADGESGATVEELAVTHEEGIPQDEFVRIAEQLYDETARLDRAYLRGR